jgi:hypothetical protein
MTGDKDDPRDKGIHFSSEELVKRLLPFNHNNMSGEGIDFKMISLKVFTS